MLQAKIQEWIELADKRNLAVDNPVTLTTTRGLETFMIYVGHYEPSNTTLPLNVTWIVVDEQSPHHGQALQRLSTLPSTGYRHTWFLVTDLEQVLGTPQFWDVSGGFQLGEIQTSAIGPATDIARGLYTLSVEPHPDNIDSPIVVSDQDQRLTNARQATSHTHPEQPRTLLLGSTGLNDHEVVIGNALPPAPGQILCVTDVTEDGTVYAQWVTPNWSDIDYDGMQFLSLEIESSAGTSLNEGQTSTFQANAMFSDAIVQTGVAASWSIIAGQAAANINATTGVLTALQVDGDQTVRVRAEWTHAPSRVTRSSTFDLTVVDTTVIAGLVRIEINGPSNINEGSTGSFTVTAFYDDDTSKAVVPNTLTSSNAGAGSINTETGVFTAPQNVNSNQTTEITASFVANGVSRTASRTLTVIDTTVYPATARIVGPDFVNENTTQDFRLEVTFTDGSTSQVAVSDWATSEGTAGSINAVTGTFTAPVNLNQTINTTLTASYSSNGRTVTGTKTIAVRDTSIYPVSAVIEGPSAIDENNSATYSLRVTFSDTTIQVVPVTNWAIDIDANSSIGPTTGVLQVGAVNANTDGTISASFTQSGTTVEATFFVTVRDTTVYPVSLTVEGSNTMNEGAQQTLIARVHNTDNSVSIVSASYVSSDESIATVGPNTGVVRAAANVLENKPVTITATYSASGRTVVREFTINVIDTTVYPVSATIIGPNALAEGESHQFELRVVLDNEEERVVPVSTWTTSNNAAGSITTTGLFSAVAETTENLNTVIRATYTVDGVTVTATLPLTVRDDTVYPVSATIVGLSTVRESNTHTYSLRVTFSNGDATSVPVTNWSSSNTAAATINASTGVLTALDVVSNQTTTISASYTAHGITVGDELAVTITDETVYPQSATIVGSDVVDEGETESYVFRVTFSDASTSNVPITNWATDNSGVATIGTNTGVLVAASNLLADTPVVVSGSYTLHGVTVSATKAVSVIDTTAYPASVLIEGPTSVAESTVGTYRALVTFTDGSSSYVDADWTSSNVDAGTFTVTGDEATLVAASVSRNQVLTTDLAVSYTAHGRVVESSTTVTVQDTGVYVESATIDGANTVDEGQSTQLTFRVTYTDNSQQNVVVSDWESGDTDIGTVSAEGLFTATHSVLEDKTVVVTASYTEAGYTVTASKTMNVINSVSHVVDATIEGPLSVLDTSLGQQYTLRLHFDDGSSRVVTTDSWTLTGEAGTIDADGLFVPTQLNGGTAVANIEASYELNGVEVSDSIEVVVTHVVRPVSITIDNEPLAVDEGQYIDLSATLVLTDSQAQPSSNIVWTLSSNSHAIIIGNRITAVANVTEDRVVAVTATYEQGGVTVSDTANVTVRNSQNLPIQVRVFGPETVDEGSDVVFGASVTFEDGTVVTQLDAEKLSWTLNGVTQDSSIITFEQTDGDTVVEVGVSYTDHGTTVSHTQNITVIDTTVVPGPRARWGIAQFSDTDFTGGKTNPNMAGTDYERWTGPQHFIDDELTSIQNDAGPYLLNLYIPYEPAPMYGYFAHPSSMGRALFTDNVTTWTGAWEGMTWGDSEIGDSYEPLEVLYDDGNGPELWTIYRTDFSGIDDITYTVTIS